MQPLSELEQITQERIAFIREHFNRNLDVENDIPDIMKDAFFEVYKKGFIDGYGVGFTDGVEKKDIKNNPC